MENTIFVGLSRQMALRREMDVVANNLANMNTTAYKRQTVLFQEYLIDAGTEGQTSYVIDFGLARDATEGRLQKTDNPFDLALTGNGYLVVETEEGPRYTRNGRLHLNEDGVLVASSGDPVLNQSGTEVTIGDADGAIEVAPDGTISTRLGVIGRLDVVTFQDTQALQPGAAGLYSTEEVPIPATDAKIRQGLLERSNVEPIVEMTNMINVLRSYQSSQKLLDTDHDLIRKAIESLAKT